MAFDFIGQIFGKARRRAAEGALSVNFGSIGKRLAVGLAAVAVVAKEKPDMLTTRNGLIGLAVTGCIAMIPAGSAPTGILTSAQPGSPSLVDAAAAAITTLINAPKAQKQAAFQAAVAQEVRNNPQLITLVAQEAAKINLTGQFTPEQLGQAHSQSDTSAVVSQDAQNTQQTTIQNAG